MPLARLAAIVMIAVVARGMLSVPIVVAASAIVVPAMIAVPVVPAMIAIPIVTVIVSIDRAASVGMMHDGGPVFGLIDPAFADATRNYGAERDCGSQHCNQFQWHTHVSRKADGYSAA
jgi:hypothetical protein